MEKYLARYAEAETAALKGLPEGLKWRNVVAIPASNEDAGFLASTVPDGGRSLMILVINQTADAPASVSRRNQQLFTAVIERSELIWRSDRSFEGVSLQLLQDRLAERDILLVDRFTVGCQLPEKGGVGHARKTAADLAVALRQKGLIDSPWVHCTDADVCLPTDYFNAGWTVSDDAAALVYPFHHSDDIDLAESAEVVLATQMYELSLRYYVTGMTFAGSPYAFHTIGSTMAVNARHYAMVRGFPKRQAGEDFYLLNKLAKVGEVVQLRSGPDCHPIDIASRRSERVPFGTGAAVNKMTTLKDLRRGYLYYHPDVFELLACWLKAIPAIFNEPDRPLGGHILGMDGPDLPATSRRRYLLQGLDSLGVTRALEHAFRQSAVQSGFERHVSTWFDAFRTLKLIHFLRDHCLPSIPLQQLQTQQLFGRFLDIDDELRAFYEGLHLKGLC